MVRNGERGIWTLAPGLPTYTLSRGASSASWVFLLKFIFYDIHFTSSSTHRLLYLMDFSLSTCFLRFCYIFLYHSLAKLNSTPLWNLILQKLASLFYNKKNINLLSLHLDAILFLKNLHRLVTCAVRRTYIRKGLSLFKRLAFSYWRTILETNYPAFTVPRGFKCRNNREINDTHTNLTTSIYCSKPSSIISPVESKRTELRALR